MKKTIIAWAIAPLAAIPFGIYFGLTAPLEPGDTIGGNIIFFALALPVIAYAISLCGIPIHFIFRKLGIRSFWVYTLLPPSLLTIWLLVSPGKLSGPESFYVFSILTCALVPAVFWFLAVREVSPQANNARTSVATD